MLRIIVAARPKNCALDSSFGIAGKVVTDFSGGGGQANALAIQADGKIVAAGVTSTSNGGRDFGLARYNTNGSLDVSFGSGGMVATGFFGIGEDEARAIVIQPDNKIVVAGKAQIGFNFSAFDFAVARYNSNGGLDSTFGSGGKVTTDIFGIFDQVNGVALQPDGKIIAAGQSFQDNPFVTISDFAVARYNSDGSLDSTFGPSGTVTTDFFGSVDQANAVALQADGNIVVAGAGNRGLSLSPTFALARYRADGSLDMSFGSAGKVTTDFNGDAEAHGVAVQIDGKIVAAGFTGAPDFALARYSSNGSLDSTFGSSGKVTTDFFGSIDRAVALALQTDGKVVVVGEAFGGIGFEFAVARYTFQDFDICLQDDSNGNLLQFNSITGDYQFTRCGTGIVLGGTGTLTTRGSQITLQHNTSDRRVLAKIDNSIKKGSASVQVFSLGKTFTISDRNTTNNACSCPLT